MLYSKTVFSSCQTICLTTRRHADTQTHRRYTLSKLRLIPPLIMSLLWVFSSISFELYSQVCGYDSISELEGRTHCEDWDFNNKDALIPGKSYVFQLYVYILRPDNGIGGPSKEYVLDIIELSKRHFSVHNILLNVVCIKDTLDDYWYNNPGNTIHGDHDDIHPTPTDGMYLYVADKTDPPFIGSSAQFHRRKSWANFEYHQNEYQVSNLVSHEIGHTLRLRHTENNTLPWCQGHPFALCPEYSGTNSFECETRGDFVCDTPGDNGLWNPAGFVDCEMPGGESCPDPDDDPYLNTPGANIMNDYYWVCVESQFFTTGQGERMQRYLQINLSSQEIEELIIADDVEITNTEVWDEDTYMSGNIVIKKGGVLTLDEMTLYMAYGKEIVVETGGRLFIDGSIITAFPSGNGEACFEGSEGDILMWKGITVLGDPAYSQFQKDGDGHWRQGRLTMNNGSTIEHAEIGISVGLPFMFGSTQGGGVILISNSTILNCNTGISFYRYANVGGGFIFPNISSISSSNFVTNSNYKGPDFQENIFLHQVQGVKFHNCHFTNSIDDTHNFGIRTSDAYFIVNANTQGNTSFTGFTFAIHSSNSLSSLLPFRVDNAHFEQNRLGIYSSGVNFAAVTNCTFEVGNYVDSEAIQEGIFVEASTGFAIRNNQFTGEGTADKTIGIRVKDSGPNINLIDQNTFTELGRGNQAEGTNVDLNFPHLGLRYRCNLNSDVTETDFRTIAPGVSRSQGLFGDPAKNTFSHTINSLPSDWWNDLGMMPITYRSRNISNEIPNAVQNVVVQVFQDPFTGCPTSPTNEGPHDHPNTELRPHVVELIGAINGYIDDGDTQGLISDVNNVGTGTPALTILSELQGLTPWLSTDVLIALSDRTDAFTEVSMFDLMWDNPDALSDGRLLSHLVEKTNPMSQLLIDSLLLAYGTQTARTHYLDSLSFALTALQQGINNYLHQALQDTSGISIANLKSILEPGLLEFRPGDMIGLYLFDGDISGLISFHDSMSNLSSLSEYEVSWYEDMGLIIDALEAMELTDTSWTGLSSGMIDSIDALIGSAHPWVEHIAMGVMNTWFGQNYFYEAIWDEAETRSASNSQHKDVLQDEMSLLKVFPNPSSGLVHFKMNSNSSNTIQSENQLRILDLQGNIIIDQRIGNVWEWNCVNCASGWYLYRLVSSDGEIHTGKISLIK